MLLGSLAYRRFASELILTMRSRSRGIALPGEVELMSAGDRHIPCPIVSYAIELQGDLNWSSIGAYINLSRHNHGLARHLRRLGQVQDVENRRGDIG